MISVNYAFSGSVMTVTNAKSLAESEKLNLKIRSEGEKLLTIGCHFPPKSTNFGTLPVVTDYTASIRHTLSTLTGGRAGRRWWGCTDTGYQVGLPTPDTASQRPGRLPSHCRPPSPELRPGPDRTVTVQRSTAVR